MMKLYCPGDDLKFLIVLLFKLKKKLVFTGFSRVNGTFGITYGPSYSLVECTRSRTDQVAFL